MPTAPPRLLSPAFPDVLATVVVVVTGNHFVLDAAAGAVVVLGVAGAWHVLARRRQRPACTG